MGTALSDAVSQLGRWIVYLSWQADSLHDSLRVGGGELTYVYMPSAVGIWLLTSFIIIIGIYNDRIV